MGVRYREFRRAGAPSQTTAALGEAPAPMGRLWLVPHCRNQLKMWKHWQGGTVGTGSSRDWGCPAGVLGTCRAAVGGAPSSPSIVSAS